MKITHNFTGKICDVIHFRGYLLRLLEQNKQDPKGIYCTAPWWESAPLPPDVTEHPSISDGSLCPHLTQKQSGRTVYC